ncbi:putative type IV pilus assembly PilZ [Magnetofaba australis IT-1]|uniref:Putative type IV pilus assembly PilZ n=2 Tax=Magnetofaba TaxID=1472292 RepID=A0A1Y2JYY8_9PROT|nr:putative type IV pilus assembly PilZ [Magnetofaba australis IT-1]
MGRALGEALALLDGGATDLQTLLEPLGATLDQEALLALMRLPWEEGALQFLQGYPLPLRGGLIRYFEAMAAHEGMERITPEAMRRLAKRLQSGEALPMARAADNAEGGVAVNAEAITNPQRIAALLQEAAQADIHLALAFAQQPELGAFTTRLHSVEATAGEGEQSPPCLRIEPLLPAMGNLHLRRSPQVMVEYRKDHAHFAFACRFCGQARREQGRLFELSLPQRMEQKPDKRRQPRVLAANQDALTLKVSDIAGGEFDAKVQNISFGGLSFAPKEGKRRFKEGEQLAFALQGEGVDLSVRGEVVKSAVIQGQTSYHVRLILKRSHVIHAMERLLESLAARQLKQRQNLFGQ